MLLSDSADQCQEANPSNTKEEELINRMKEAKKNIKNGMALGVIGIETPEAYFRLICFTISYKTGTSLKDVMGMSFFDLFTYSYIVNKFSEESGVKDGNPTPEQKDLNQLGNI